MKTTLMLDDDLAEKLRERTKNTGKSLKDVVNDTLRLGLREQSTIAGNVLEPFHVNARPLGAKQGIDYNNVAELLEHAEGFSNR